MIKNGSNVSLGDLGAKSKTLHQPLSNFVGASTSGPGKPKIRRAFIVYKKPLPSVVQEEQSSFERDCFDDGEGQFNVRLWNFRRMSKGRLSLHTSSRC